MGKGLKTLNTAVILVLLGIIGGYVIINQNQGPFDKNLGFFETNGFTLNETNWWRQKSHLMNSHSYVSVPIDELQAKVFELRDAKGECLVCYDSEGRFIWVFDVSNIDQCIYYWDRARYATR